MINSLERLDQLSPEERRALLAELLSRQARGPKSYPLSFAQQRLWFIEQLLPGNPAYNISTTVRLLGELDITVIEQSLNAIVERHESLRTTFALVQGRPMQIISPAEHLTIELIDRQAAPATEYTTEIQDLAVVAAQRAFDLARGPLVRAIIIRLGQREHLALLIMHHIITDGWSVGVLIQELAELYRSFAAGRPADLPPLPIQYADFTLWQNEWLQGPVLATQLAYWKQQLAGLTPLELPTDHPRRAIPTFRGALHFSTIPADLFVALTTLQRREGVTLYMVLLAAFQALLYRYTGQDDIAVGAPIANRTRSELEGLIGCFVNTLVFRTNLSGAPTFRELLRRVRLVTQDAYAHQDLPFEKLVEVLQPERDLSRSPLFQVMFVLQNIPIPPQAVDDLLLEPIRIDPGVAKFDLLLEITETQTGLDLVIEYASDLFEAATIARLAGHFQTLLAGIVATPDQSINALPILTAAEQQLLAAWNSTAASYPGPPCIHQLIEEQIERAPDRIALVFEDIHLTYRALNTRANRLAHHLRHDIGSGGLVGICLERSPELVVGLLGILKAGGAYVPLDPDAPLDRLAWMLADARPPVVLTQQMVADHVRLALGQRAAPAATPRVICLDTDWGAIATEPAHNPHSAVGGDDLAYVIYTSGSTGRPKGALNAHRGIRNRLLWMQDAYGLDAHDRVLQKTPFSFDVSVWEFFWPLIAGAHLVLACPGGHKDRDYLVDLIVREHVTTMHFVPPMLQVFLEHPGVSRCTALRRVICSGEALPAALAQRCFARLPQAELHNLYGPTEAAVDVSAWACRAEDDGPVPIGRPIANAQLYVLDRRLQPLPIGAVGELHIGGVPVGYGYLSRPDLTAERFVPNPFATRNEERGTRSDAPGHDADSSFILHPSSFGERLYRTGDLARYRADGAIEYVGRLDDQVKLRGFRIEPGEVASVLREHARVREAVVVAREDLPGERQLVAYIIPTTDDRRPTTGDSRPTTHDPRPSILAELRAFLKQKLPEYMVPATFVLLDALPLSPNGKLDRRALPAPDTARPDMGHPFAAPRTPAEQALAEIWAQVLRRDQVGIHDNFFALGGDSIRSIGVLALAQERGLHFSLQQLFQHQTIFDLAQSFAGEVVGERPAATIAPFSLIAPEERRRLPDDLEDAFPLAALQAGMLFHSEYSPNTAIYHDVFTLHLRAPLALSSWQAAVRELTARHPVLRTSFDLDHFSEPLQFVHRAADVPLEIADLRDLSPTEQAALLDAWIDTERRRHFDWARAPLLRMQIHRRSEESFQFTLSFHHAILDGWSVASMLTELSMIYLARLGKAAPAIPPPPRIGFRDFVALERQTLESTEARDYWMQKLRDHTVTLVPRWPSGRSERAGPQVQMYLVPLAAGLVEELQRLAEAAGVALKSVLLAAHLRVLQVVSGQSDILTGLVSHGRPEQADGERVLGLFLNTLPFRLALPGGSWRELTRAAFAAEREMQPFRRYPMAHLQREFGGQPLFETAFNFNHFHVYQGVQNLAEIQHVDSAFFEETNFTLVANFRMHESSQLDLVLAYDAAQIPEDYIQAIGGYYLRTLTAMLEQPDGRYDQHSPLSPQERQLLLAAWNPPYDPHAARGCIHTLIADQAERTPEAIALAYEDQCLSYRALHTRSNQLAHYLRSLGVGPEVRVGLCIERSLEMIVGVLGILKAGGAYVPLDPAYPPEHMAYMIQDSRMPVVITRQQLVADLPCQSAQPVCLDADWQRVAQEPIEQPPSGVVADNLAYVLYTSGSTGRPKGVQIAHGSLVSYLRWVNEQLLREPGQSLPVVTSLTFDASLKQLFAPLLRGGTVWCLPTETTAQPAALIQALATRTGGALNCVPTLWAAILDALDAGLAELPRGSLTTLYVGGEQLSQALVERSLAALPDLQIWNIYGPTEATANASVARVAPLENVTIGRPIANTQIYLLDKQLLPAPVGTPGELYIGGVGLARGYHRRPDLTAERFIPNPFAKAKGKRQKANDDEDDASLLPSGERLYRSGDLARYRPDGMIELLGRVDHQVKIRGFRVELGAIEARLRQHANVREAVVTAWDDPPGGSRLVAYIVPRQAPAPAITALRAFLQAALPGYMVPAAFLAIEALPLLPNGKIDRAALPLPDAARPTLETAFIAPRTPTEQALAQIWADVLRIEQVGVQDNFFELGGHSLLTTQVVSRVRATFQIELPLRSLFDAPTVAGLAEHIETVRWAAQHNRSHPDATANDRDAGEI